MDDEAIALLLGEMEQLPTVKGDDGPRGPRGYKGLAGQDGDDGERGPRGPKGDKGDKGDPGRDGKAGTSVERATAHSLPPEREPTAEFNPRSGLLKLGIPRGEKGAPGISGTPRVSPRTGNLLFGGGSGGGGGSGEHPNLASHDTLGLATDAELAAHAATSHGAAYIASDDFSDTQTDSWGSADQGGDWTLTGTAVDFDKAAGVGTVVCAAGATRIATLDDTSAADLDLSVRVQVNSAVADIECGILVRSSADGGTAYVGGLWFEADSTVTAILHERTAGVENPNVFALNQGTYAANQYWWIRYQIIGTSQKVKVWKDGDSPPTAWSVEDTDTTITAAGRVGLMTRSILGAGRTTTWDDLNTDPAVAGHVAATSHEHANLAVHDALGLATDAELTAHAATLHDAAIPTYIQATDPALAPPAKYLWVDTNTDFLWYNDGQVG